MSTHVNKTTILFNERFKEFIIDLSLKVEREWFSTSYGIDFDEMHSWIQKYVLKYASLINYTGSITSMPNLYAINICLLLGREIENISSFDKIIFRDTFSQIYYANSAYHDDNAALEVRCACKHKISPQNTFRLKSNVNKITIQLGDDCIQKTGISSSFLNNLKKEARRKYRASKALMKLVVHELHEEFNKRQFCRRCISCKQYNIAKSEPSFKTRCPPCFKKSIGLKERVRDRGAVSNDLSKVIYFEIPFEKKDEFKRMGGKFDGDNKLWYMKKSLVAKHKSDILKLGKEVKWD
uniref:DUF5710 domain-containing protein n=1 Tax=viral metagenome TaxID=1070528 RepID=A0A6C0B038_9ZZZZ